MQNTSLTHWQRAYHHDQIRWRLVAYNDVVHLRELSSAPEAVLATPKRPVEEVMQLQGDE